MSRVSIASMPMVFVASLVAAVSCGPETPGQRQEPAPPPPVLQPLPEAAFHVEWGAHTVPATMKAGASIPVSVTFKNVSSVPWLDKGSTGYQPPQGGAVRLAYHWWSPTSPTPMLEPSARADLQRPLAPGQSVTLAMTVTAPAVPGAYKLQLDLVQELVTWFEAKGAAQLIVPVRVL